MAKSTYGNEGIKMTTNRINAGDNLTYTTRYEANIKNVPEHIFPAPRMRQLEPVSINRSLSTGSTTSGMND
jgi:hypothetical protein